MVDISLIDVPGPNRDSWQTTTVFALDDLGIHCTFRIDVLLVSPVPSTVW